VLLFVLACAVPTSALAEPMPAGTYDFHLTGGTVKFGGLPSVGIGALPSMQVALADQPVTTPLPTPYTLTVFVGITISTTLTSGQATVDPSTGAISADVSFYTVIKAVPNAFTTLNGTCTFGSAEQPVALHLRTTPESVWKPGSFAFTVYDNDFAVPAPACDNAELGTTVTNLAADTSAGHNSATIVGTAARPGDIPPPPPPPPPADIPAPSTSGGSASTPTGSSPSGTRETTASEPRAPAAKAPARCVVPKLIGLSLGRAKLRLVAAHCRLGKVTRKRTRRSSRGHVLAQKLKPRTSRPAGTRVALTLGR
jgi:hypothetical protein